MPNEITEYGLEHSESQDSTSTDPLEQGQSVASDEQEHGESNIPAKFVGKSAAEIIASYQELEKRYGQQGTEKSTVEKRANELAQKANQYEMALSQVSQRGNSAQSTASTDPIQVFEKAWQEQGPVEAIKQMITLNQQQNNQYVQQRNFDDVKSYVERQKQENPEFVELLPEMEKLAHYYEPFLAPEVRASKQAVDMMFNLAKAANISKYTQAEATKLSEKTEIIKTKKRMSGAESSSASQGESAVNFSELSTADMEKLLGFANK